MADNNSNDRNGLADHVAISDELQETQQVDLTNDVHAGPQQADPVIDLTAADSERHPVVLSSPPPASPQPDRSPDIAANLEQHDDPAEHSQLSTAPVAEMVPPNPPDSPLFCPQEPEAAHESVAVEPFDHQPAASSPGPVYSYAPTQPSSGGVPLCDWDTTHGSTAATHEGSEAGGKRYYFCPICHKGYTRKHRVRNHFDICQYEKGNPDRLTWDADPSCWPKRITHDDADRKCPICQCVFTRASEAKAHFVLCANLKGNPNNIIFQGMETGRDTKYGEEDGEIGAFRCSLCCKLSSKQSHAREHWKNCRLKAKTPEEEWVGRYDDMGRFFPGSLPRYDNMGRFLPDRWSGYPEAGFPEKEADTGKEPADNGMKAAKEPGHQGSWKYRCELCGKKNRKLDKAEDHFQPCIDGRGLTRQDVSYLNDTGMRDRSMPLEPMPGNVRVSEPRTKRSRRVAFEDDTSLEAAPGAKKHAAEESVAAGAAADTLGTRGGITGMEGLFLVIQHFQPHEPKHTVRVCSSLRRANKWAANYFIQEVASGWTTPDEGDHAKTAFAAGVKRVLQELDDDQGYWGQKRDCKLREEEGTLVVWVEKKAAATR